MIPAESQQLNDSLAFVAGDTWQGIPSFTFTPSPSVPLAFVRMNFRDTLISTRTVESLVPTKPIPESPSLTQIVILSSNNWSFYIPPQKMPCLKAGIYAWQIETTDAIGNVQTYCQGTIKVYSDIVTP